MEKIIIIKGVVPRWRDFFFLLGVPSPPSPPGRFLCCAGWKGMETPTAGSTFSSIPVSTRPGALPECLECLREGNRGCSLPSLLPESGGEAAAPPQCRHLSVLGAPAAGKPRARSDGESPRWQPRSSSSHGDRCLVPVRGCPHAVTSRSVSAPAGSRIAFPLGGGAGNLGED